MLKIFTLIAFIALFSMNFAYSQFRISGIVEDSITAEGINSAKVEIYGKGKLRYTNSNGEFSFDNLSPGLYTITISKESYISQIRTYILDSLNQSVNLIVKLQTFESVTDTIDVSAKYFKKAEDVNTSYMNVEYEEIRKSPGALEDVIGYFTSAPGVSLGNDINNELIIRGGSPVENLTLIDGLEIQNPNHYGAPGSTNGVLSYINLKLVKDVDFFTGGFPAKYGDKLSGVMDIKFKEGNRIKHIRDLNVSATGLGGFFEGPITKKSSYMFSVRRSYLELIKDELTTPLVPEYWDFNTKFNYDLSKTDKISLTGLFAIDKAKPFEEGDFMFDTVNVKILSAGMNYNKKGKDFDFRFITGFNWNFYKVNYQDFILDINDNEISVKQELDYKLHRNMILNIFTGARYFFSEYKVSHGAGFNASNYYTPGVSFDSDVNTFKVSGGFNIISYLFKGKLTLNTGLRFDSFQLISDKLSISPRLGLSYKLTPVTTLNANAGVYFQSPEILWVLVDVNNRNLDYMRVDEIVLGVEHYISNDIKITVEPYLKQYYDYPVSVYDPNFIFINSGVEIYPNFLDRAVSAGKGYFAGVDITFQKRNSLNGFFWTLTYSFSKSEFLALAGDIQLAEFDYGNQLMAMLGFKFNFGLTLSSRFKFAEGRPYTPYDMDESYQYYRGIYDKSMYNKAKMPDYVRLDVRADQHFKFNNINLIVYFEVLNVLDRTNYYNYYWSSFYSGLKANLQFPRIPILGISFQF